MKEKLEAERRTLRKVGNGGYGDAQRNTRNEKEVMMPPTTSLTSGDTEEIDSADFEQLAKQEILKCRLNTLKKQQAEYTEELAKLDVEKEEQIREVRRLREEENSKYCGRPLLQVKTIERVDSQSRYQVIEMLGKGGFSEVWHAYDLQQLTDVAIKIHQLSSAWSDERKSNYIKHAIRENDIQKRLQHENVVRQLDSFVIDSDSFATVLEYCPGTDPERYLKQNVVLKEAEARAITIQVWT